jgi:hypothetical protein
LKEVAKTWVAGEGMLDRRGSVLDGSIVAGERMVDRCDYRSFKMDSEQCLNFWLSPVM